MPESHIISYSEDRLGFCIFKQVTAVQTEYVSGPFKSESEAQHELSLTKELAEFPSPVKA